MCPWDPQVVKIMVPRGFLWVQEAGLGPSNITACTHTVHVHTSIMLGGTFGFGAMAGLITVEPEG